MSLSNVLTLLGGVALFLFGMNIMGNGLEKMSGGRLEKILERLTSNVFKSMLLGLSVTAVIQSSSATTVMLVGFVNAGIMKLTQVVGVIMGANIGTTVTSFLLSLGDIDSGNTFLLLLKPVSLAPIMAVIGIVLYMFSRGGKKHDIGQILIGFGTLFFGMLTMEQSMAGLKSVPEFVNLMTAVSNPILGLLVGLVMTAIIQSSSASVGILQALSATGAIRFNAAAPIILGQNIGTCVTALISSVGASRNAKRTAMIHLYFNIIGTILFLALLYSVNALFKLPFWESTMNRSTIAIFHLTFNLLTTMVLLPFNKLLVKLATITVRGRDSGEIEIGAVLDERFLASPSVALNRAEEAVTQMTAMARDNFKASCVLLFKYDDRKVDLIKETERTLDKLEVSINNYLLKLIERDLTVTENLRQSELLHTIGDIERIGDYSINVAEAAKFKHERGIEFSASAVREITALIQAVGDLIDLTFQCYGEDNAEAALRVEPLEETVDLITELLKSRHIERLKRNACSAEAGSVFLELLIHFERIADHCSNVALYLLQRHMGAEGRQSFDIHAYAHHLHEGNSHDYRNAFKEYSKTYLTMIDDTNEKLTDGGAK